MSELLLRVYGLDGWRTRLTMHIFPLKFLGGMVTPPVFPAYLSPILTDSTRMMKYEIFRTR